jgi:hypothetical protein
MRNKAGCKARKCCNGLITVNLFPHETGCKCRVFSQVVFYNLAPGAPGYDIQGEASTNVKYANIGITKVYKI